MGVNGWVDLQSTQVQTRLGALASEARAERLARTAGHGDGGAPTLRARLNAAITAWKQPGRIAAA